MSKKNGFEEEVRRELGKALDVMRKEVDKIRKDMVVATKAAVKTTERVVRDVSPKVSASIDEAMKETSEAFHKGMTSLGKESKQAQIGFLRGYRTVLGKQLEFVEQRLKELTN